MIPVALQQNNQQGYGYPFCLLPEKLVDVIRYIEHETQAPPEMIASSLLGVMSLACQDVFDVSPKDTLRFPVSLYQIILAESGERKSAVDRILLRSVRNLERDLEIQYLDEMQDFEQRKSLWSIEARALEKAIKTAILKGGDKSDFEEKYKLCLASKPCAPVFRRLLINDATRAAVKQALGFGRTSIGLVSDESGSILQSDLLRDTPLLNSLWSECSINIDRANCARFSINDVRFGLMLMVQPGVFSEYLKTNGPQARASGFFARVLICQPKSTIGNRLNRENHLTVMTSIIERNRPSATVMEWFNNRVRELYLQGFKSRQEGKERLCLTLSKEARSMWVNEYNNVEVQCGDSGRLKNYKDYASKHLEHVTRIAGVIEGFTSGGSIISEQTMHTALNIAAWYFDSFIRLMEVEPQEISDAQSLESWLGSGKARSYNGFYYKNDILQYGSNSLRKRDRLNRAIDVLRGQNKIVISYHGKKECIFYLSHGGVYNASSQS